ncbi:hypothetical protein OAG24_00750 [bacterium]|nr:hypothetical protein [bacterium]
MTNIKDKYIYELKFSVDPWTCNHDKYLQRWKDFKTECESGENSKNIVEQIKNYCQLEQNKNLSYLDRLDGGMGKNDGKQIRFRNTYLTTTGLPPDNDIILNNLFNTKTEKWTYEELDDLVNAFIKVGNSKVRGDEDDPSDYVDGWIQLKNIL